MHNKNKKLMIHLHLIYNYINIKYNSIKGIFVQFHIQITKVEIILPKKTYLSYNKLKIKKIKENPDIVLESLARSRLRLG